jgi:hypothetical protein
MFFANMKCYYQLLKSLSLFHWTSPVGNGNPEGHLFLCSAQDITGLNYFLFIFLV